jgi:hypothetical protein
MRAFVLAVLGLCFVSGGDAVVASARDLSAAAKAGVSIEFDWRYVRNADEADESFSLLR